MKSPFVPLFQRGKKRDLSAKASRKALLPLKKGGREGFLSRYFKKLNWYKYSLSRWQKRVMEKDLFLVFLS